jgi:hypothetical protein
MVRLGVVLYLGVVTAAGPWLCCCTVTRLACGLLTPPVPTVAATHAKAPPCCCCEEPAPPADSTPAEPVQRDCPECPCRQGASELVAVPPAAPEPVAAVTPAAGLVPCLAAVDHSVAVLFFTSLPLPFWNADDLLHVSHRLRC